MKMQVLDPLGLVILVLMSARLGGHSTGKSGVSEFRDALAVSEAFPDFKKNQGCD